MNRLTLRDSKVEAAATDGADAELASAIRDLRASVDASTAQMARLANAIERLLGHPAEPVGDAAKLAPRLTPVPARLASGRASINWVVGPQENLNWAYGNNARRLSERLSNFDHLVSSNQASDIAVYFDALVAERYPAVAQRSVLRIGGPRPLNRLFGEDTAALAAFLAKFEAVIALNAELYLRTAKLHPNVRLIPNALDLTAWRPVTRDPSRPFTAGFAASLKSKAEIEMKGLAIAEAAAAKCGVPLLLTSKGDGQIPHDRMYADFYSKIDVLLHPVAAGREGTSNVIMEALGAGVPVITTLDAGFHGEFLFDRRTALIRRRDVDEFADAIRQIQRDAQLRNRLNREGRRFAEEHHSIERIARQYAQVFEQLGKATDARPKRRKVAFVPFWEPVGNFGSSRLRAQYPASYLSKTGAFEVQLGYSSDADIVIVVQMCSDELMNQLSANREQFVIYDVCDKYYEKPRLFRHLEPAVDSLTRFHELSARADLVLVPSQELKVEVASRLLEKPVKYMPEPVDYETPARPARRSAEREVLWFGNPDRGNFECVRWMLQRLRDTHGFKLRLVSRKSFFRAHPDFQGCVVDWSQPAMAQAFASASLCVLGYHDDEQAKSANRFITSIMHGIPTLVSGSPACREILEAAGHHFALVSDERSLDRALAKLDNEEFRSSFVDRVQRHIARVHGEAAISEQYVDLLDKHTFQAATFSGEARRVAFVSHNLALGEGAPMSLLELSKGLRRRGIQPFVFSPVGGPLAEQYRNAGIPIEIFDERAHNGVKTINNSYASVRDAFVSFLRKNGIETLVCNTVKSSPYMAFAHDEGLAGLIIVRESYAAPERFSHFEGEARLASIKGLTRAEQVVFVANTSRQTWEDLPLQGEVHVIPNGIAMERFDAGGRLDKQRARLELGMPADDVVALCVGSVNLRKGQLQLLRAFQELPERVRSMSRIVFLGAGQSNYVSEFLAQVERLPSELRARVQVVPAVSNVAPYYAAADLFLMNSRSEAYPRSIVESLLWGVPVLSTPVFGVREQIRQGLEGFLYEHDDMATWRSHFSALALDAALRSRMSQEAQRSFWRLTGYPEMLLSYQALLARVLPRRQASAATLQQGPETANDRGLGVSEERVGIASQLAALPA
jgi:glycosyltransferase involved in cell wall biosynthesis